MKKMIIALSAAVILCLTLCVYLLTQNHKDKLMVVDAVRLVNSYNMKKELEAVDSVKLNARVHAVDSLEQLLRAMQQTGAPQDQDLIQAYRYHKTMLEQEYEQSNAGINEQVWQRLNPLIEAFGKKEKAGIIIGANGMGSVLYTDKVYDVTDQMINYVNKAYEGAK